MNMPPPTNSQISAAAAATTAVATSRALAMNAHARSPFVSTIFDIWIILDISTIVND